MIFVTLLEIAPERNKEAFEALKKLKVPKGIDLKFLYSLFGRIDTLLPTMHPKKRLLWISSWKFARYLALGTAKLSWQPPSNRSIGMQNTLSYSIVQRT